MAWCLAPHPTQHSPHPRVPNQVGVHLSFIGNSPKFNRTFSCLVDQLITNNNNIAPNRLYIEKNKQKKRWEAQYICKRFPVSSLKLVHRHHLPSFIYSSICCGMYIYGVFFPPSFHSESSHQALHYIWASIFGNTQSKTAPDEEGTPHRTILQIALLPRTYLHVLRTKIGTSLKYMLMLPASI